jgi:branched-chain amino acid transport system ATP-binding protein
MPVLHGRALTILLVEQNVSVALNLSQHAHVLEPGRIVLSGSDEQLLHDDRGRHAFLGL